MSEFFEILFTLKSNLPAKLRVENNGCNLISLSLHVQEIQDKKRKLELLDNVSEEMPNVDQTLLEEMQNSFSSDEKCLPIKVTYPILIPRSVWQLPQEKYLLLCNFPHGH